jgi:hypothetical protein
MANLFGNGVLQILGQGLNCLVMAKKKAGIIKNIGLFWHRDKVCWEKKQLSGRLKSARRKNTIAFWDQKGIYALYDYSYNLVYVGQTIKEGLGARLKKHLSNDLAGRWELFSWFGLRKVKSEKLAESPSPFLKICYKLLLEQLEAVTIAIAEPRRNSQSGRFGKVERYIQPDNEGSQEKTLSRCGTTKKRFASSKKAARKKRS